LDLFGDRTILTVTRLTSLIRGVLEENFEHVWVEGEISNLAMPASGHLYFTLKDAGAQIRCVMFRASARALRFKLRDGMGLVVRGRVSLFEPRGEYQLIVEYLEPQGIGALQLAFNQLKEKLAKEGLFDEKHKKPVPRLPQRIGVVTSATGAAIHDILNVLDRRFANVQVLIRPVKVQGEGAAAEIAEAIRDFNRYGDIDVMIVGRGGGSMEDLWAFNEEAVARAVFHSRIPVISAVGHEVDFTIADFVADLRAPTPSAAAELVVKSKAELVAELDSLAHRLRQSIRHNLDSCRSRMDITSRSLRDPSMLLGHLSQRIDDLFERLGITVNGGLERQRNRLARLSNSLRLANPALVAERERERLFMLLTRGEHSLHRTMEHYRERSAVNSGKLQALSPLETLSRGYAVATLRTDGSVVRESGQLQAGDTIDLRLHRGGAVCIVESKE
jgi:exodeoxyribonuclease VII large subunit